MDGLIYHELFMFRKNLKSFVLVFVFMVVLVTLSVLILAAESTNPDYKVFYNGQPIEGFEKYAKKNKVKLTTEKSEAFIELKVSKGKDEIKATMSNINDSTEYSLKAKLALETALNEYKNELVKKSIKEKGLSESMLNPLVVIYENTKQVSEKEFLTGIVMPFILAAIPMFVYILFNNGFMDERRSKSITSILHIGLKNVTKIIVLLGFRSYISSLFVSVFTFVLLYVNSDNLVLSVIVAFLIFLNVSFVNSLMLLMSLRVSGQNHMTVIAIAVDFLLFFGWVMNTKHPLVYLPFFYGISVSKTILYGDQVGFNLLLCIVSYLLWYVVTVYLGTKLLKSEKVLCVDIL